MLLRRLLTAAKFRLKYRKLMLYLSSMNIFIAFEEYSDLSSCPSIRTFHCGEQ